MVAGDATKRRLFSDVLRALADLQRGGDTHQSLASARREGARRSTYATAKQVNAEPAAHTHAAADPKRCAHARTAKPPVSAERRLYHEGVQRPVEAQRVQDLRTTVATRARASMHPARTHTHCGWVCVRACVRACDAGMGMGEHLLWRFPG